MATDLERTATGTANKYDTFVSGQLDKARKRIRALDLTVALLAFLAGSCLFAVAMVLLDRQFALSQVTRQFALGIYVLGALAYLYLAVVRPLRWNVNARYAARELEANVPEAKNSVINWIDLRDQNVPSVLRGALGQRAARDLSKVDVDQAIAARSVTYAAGAALLGAAAVIVLFFLFGPRPFFSLLARTFAPFSNTTIASRTNINLLRPEGGNASIPVGSTFNVVAEITGRVPPMRSKQAPRLLYRHSPNDPYLERPLQSDESSREWTTTLSRDDMLDGIWYRIAAGDAQTDEFRVTVRAAPLVLDFLATHKYRAYTARPNRVHRDRRIVDLRGTKVELLVTSNREVRDGKLELEGTDGQVFNFIGKRDANDPRALRFDLTLDRTGKYRLMFTTPEGESYLDGTRHEMRAVPDAAPVVYLTDPDKDVELPADGVLKLKGAAVDEVGLAKLSLEMRLLDGPSLAPKPYEPKDGLKLAGGGHPREVKYQDFVDLGLVKSEDGSPRTLQAGQVLEYWLKATDACDYPRPNSGESKRYKVKILPPTKSEEQRKKEREQAEREKKEHEKKEQEERDRENREREEERRRQEEKNKEEQKRSKEKREGSQGKEGEKGGKGQKDGKEDRRQKDSDDKTQRDADKLREALDKKEKEKAEKDRNDRGEARDEGKNEKGENKPGEAREKGPEKPKEGEPSEGGEGKEAGKPEKGKGGKEGKSPEMKQPGADRPDPREASKPESGEGKEGKEAGKEQKGGKPGKDGKPGARRDQPTPEERKQAGENRNNGTDDPAEKPKQAGEARKDGQPRRDGKPGEAGEQPSRPEDGVCKEGDKEGKEKGGKAGKGGKPGQPRKGPPEGKAEKEAGESRGNGTEPLPRDARPEDVEKLASKMKRGDEEAREKAAKDLDRVRKEAKDPEARKAADKELKQHGPPQPGANREGPGKGKKQKGAGESREGGGGDPGTARKKDEKSQEQDVSKPPTDKKGTKGGKSARDQKLDRKTVEKLLKDLGKSPEQIEKALKDFDKDIAKKVDKDLLKQVEEDIARKVDKDLLKKENREKLEKLRDEALKDRDSELRKKLDKDLLEKLDKDALDKLQKDLLDKVEPKERDKVDQDALKEFANRWRAKPGEGPPFTRAPKERPRDSRPSAMQLEDFRKNIDKDLLKDLKMSPEEFQRFLKDYEDLARRTPPRPDEVLPGAPGPGTLPGVGSRLRPSGSGTTEELRHDGRPAAPPGYGDAYAEFLRRMAGKKK